ncbi:MAG: molybdopterin-dependent oxidoreductase [Rubrobacter sp.]|nr:molybdopterin-dependent oxidoreductase [Rubrobacter sp.]
MSLSRSSNNILGLLLLPLLGFSLLTGFAIWVFVGLDVLVPIALISIHAYAGLLSLPILAAKLWSGVLSWRRRTAKQGIRASPGLHLLTLGLVLLTLVMYGSGVLMYANFTPGGNAVYKQVHLWSAVLVTPLITHHLYLYLHRALEVVGTTLAPSPAGGLRITRGYLIRLGGAMFVLLAGARGAGSFLESLGSEDPNDFPVTLTSGGADRPDPEEWRLLVSGDVAEPTRFSLADLHGAALNRSTYSLDCIIGWSVVREWGGIPVMDLIRRAQPRGEIVSAVFRSTTGYEVALPLEVLKERGTMVTLEVGGVPLASEHGFPARLMAPGVIGEKCVKWLAEIEIVSRG